MRSYLIISVVVLLFTNGPVRAQDKQVAVETFFASVEKPVAESLPLPDYPDEARKSGVGGRVSVRVTVDPSGSVTVGEASGPHPVCSSVTDERVLALRAAALSAAKKARFQPIGGQTSPLIGRINYIFSLPAVPVVKDALIGVRVEWPGEAADKGSAAVGGVDGKLDVVSGGVLNGKAMTLARPVYPAAARAVRASGSVSVQVLILEDGTVYSAEAMSGHPLLRSVSEIAACESSFAGTILSGRPVKVAGRITFNFVP